MKINKLIPAILAATLLSGCGFLHKKVGYDIGTCMPESFVGAHLIYIDKVSAQFTDFQTSPTEHYLPKHEVIYTYTLTDSLGKHYLHNKIELVIKEADKEKITGVFLSDGEVAAVVFGIAGDGTQLAKHANEEVEVCRKMNATPERLVPDALDRAQAQ